ncbi:MAG: hypothetical protein P1Q69_07435 [Candidatus Thorarchaeota archaeon]|nr:hypothetical protein [Candidatus Thorarchaeota archaeon]
MIPNPVLLVLYICALVGAFIGVFLTMGFIALSGKEDWSGLRFMAVLSLGTIIATYSLPLFVISLLYPAYLMEAVQEFPNSLHGGMILGVGTMLAIGYTRDRQKKQETEITNQSPE